MNIVEIRKKLDQIDSQIIELIKQRIELLPEVVAYKKKHNLAVCQEKREKVIFENLKNISSELGVNYEMVENIWKLLIKEAHRVEHELLEDEKSEEIKLKVDFKKLKIQRKKLNLKMPLFDVFQSIYANYDHFYFLDSLEEDSELSRKSYIGFNPTHVFSAKNEKFFIDGENVSCVNPLEKLKEIFPTNLFKDSGEFVGGLIGYFGYETLKYKEDLPYFKENTEWNDFEFGLYLDGLVFDHKTGELDYFYLDQDRSEMIQDVLKDTFDLMPLTAISENPNMTDADFLKGVEKVKEHIVNGDIFQGVLSQRFNYKLQGSTLSFYKELREINPSPHMFFVKFSERELIGSSPELVARVEKGVIETFPIAGTRSRGKDEAEDQKIEAELLADEKEKAEHMMLVDMARNDLGKICDYGSVEVKKLMYTKKYSHVQHIVSNVQGNLSDEVNIIDAVLAQMPMGTVSGSPRLEAVKILNELEPTVRGPYGGGVGFLSFSRECVFALMIRSLFVNGKNAYTQAGAGLVYDSVAKHELKEVQKKSRAVKMALGVK